MPSPLARVLTYISLPVAVGLGAASLFSGGVGYVAGVGRAGTVTQTRVTTSPVILTSYITLPAAAPETETSTVTVGANGRPAVTIDGPGTYEVGVDVQPGTYRAEDSGDTCYWARLSNLTGDNDIIANSYADGPAVVTIRRTDKGFRTEGCGTWVRTR